MRLKIEVTAEDIRLGKYMDCLRCPIALAARRAFPRRRGVPWADMGAIRIRDAGGRRVEVAAMTQRAQRFMHLFDGGRWQVKPSTFYLRLLDPAKEVR